MEKTNELNKFLSYIHMGNSVYRIYYDEARELNDDELLDEIVKIQEIFKTHEESISLYALFVLVGRTRTRARLFHPRSPKRTETTNSSTRNRGSILLSLEQV